MFAAIEHFGSSAVIQDGVWYGDDPSFNKLLRLISPEDGPSGADPQPDITEAYRVARLLGAKVIEEEMDTYRAGVIY